ncbi:MAG TPA: hypothetical protein VF618_02685 [Thermoanaerobaculia bacterium]
MQFGWKSFATGVAVVAACAVGVQGAGDALSQLGVSVENAKRDAVWSLSSGQVSVGDAKRAFKAAAPAARATLVQGALTWVKAYTQTPEFAKAYAASREEAKPQAPEHTSVDAQIKADIAGQKEYVAQLKKDLAAAAAYAKADYRESVRQAEERLKEMQTADYREEVKSNLEGSLEAYRDQMNTWNTDYPADPKVQLRKRIQEFLTESANVDFNAKLVQKGRKMQFANAAYEDKPGEWKMCFRAGKEATTAARTFAAQWYRELGGK